MTKTHNKASPVRMGGNLEIYKFTFASPGVSIGNERFREISSTILNEWMNEWMNESIVFFLGSCTNSNYIPHFMDFRSAIKYSVAFHEKNWNMILNMKLILYVQPSLCNAEKKTHDININTMTSTGQEKICEIGENTSEKTCLTKWSILYLLMAWHR